MQKWNQQKNCLFNQPARTVWIKVKQFNESKMQLIALLSIVQVVKLVVLIPKFSVYD